MKHLSNYRKFFISLNEQSSQTEETKTEEQKLIVPDWFKKAFFEMADTGDRATLGLDKSMIEPSWEMVKKLQDKIAKKEFMSVKELQQWLWTQKDMKFGEGTIESHLNDYRKKLTPPKGPLTLDKFADGKFGMGTYVFLANVTRKFKEELDLSPIPTKMANINYSEPQQAAVQLKQVVQDIKQDVSSETNKDNTEKDNTEKDRVPNDVIKGDDASYEIFMKECYELINPMVVEWEKKGEKIPVPPKKGIVNKITSIFKKKEDPQLAPFLTDETVSKIITGYKKYPEIEKLGIKCFGGDPKITGFTDKETGDKLFAEFLLNSFQCYKARTFGLSFDDGSPQKVTLPNEQSIKMLYLSYMNNLKMQDRSKMGRAGVTTQPKKIGMTYRSPSTDKYKTI